MKTAIVGPGAMGCLFAAFLRRAGHTVWVIDKEATRARELAAEGIRVEGSTGTEHVPVRATADAREAGRVDCVCMAVKTYDVAAAIERALPLIGPGTAVVSLQNGIGSAEQLAARVRPGQIACAAVSHGAYSMGVGHVCHAGAGMTKVAPFDPASRWPAEVFARAAGGPGNEVQVVDDVARLLWGKLIVNAAINPLTAIHDIPNGVLLDRADLRCQMEAAAREAAAVAAAAGIDLLQTDAVEETASVCRRTRENISSMLQDVRRRRRTEIEAITGYLVSRARAEGVACPVNESLLAGVRALEKGVSSKQ